MATIKVRVQGEIATNLTPEVKLVCQNDKYDVEFEFDESWANSNFKTALFIYNGQLIAIPFDGTICKIPALYDTQLLHIGVKSDDIEGLHTTTPAKVVYLLSANDIANGEIPNPTPSQYDQIIALLNKYIQQGGGGSGGTGEERVREIAGEIVDEKISTEIPAWAKKPTKPSYTAEEVGALPRDTPLVEDIGSSVAEETNELTIELKDKNGNIIATTKVVLPKQEIPEIDMSAYVKTEDRDEFVKGGVTENSLPLTDEEKTSACEWVGAVKKIPTAGRKAYGTDYLGNETVYSVGNSNTASANSIPVRLVGGGIYIPDAAITSNAAVPRGEIATNVNYVDNLPDYLTLTDEKKVKWKTWLENILN